MASLAILSRMPKINSIYTIPTCITKSVSDVISQELSNSNLEDGTIGKENEILHYRKSKICWITTDHWVSGMMAHFIRCANTDLYGYDLDNWANFVQYTVYDKPGSYYDWHNDLAESEFNSNRIRKLSISLCLSSKDEYEGGEFQILTGKQMQSFKMDTGDAIIFPSDYMHRVRPVKSGKRVSLVGWMGGPPFK